MTLSLSKGAVSNEHSSSDRAIAVRQEATVAIFKSIPSMTGVIGYGLDPMRNNRTWLDRNCRVRDTRPDMGVYCEGWLG
jgi:hypothetical protein